jgi:hypothetical protein
VILAVKNPKHIDKLLTDWRKEVLSDYIAEDEEDDSQLFMAAVKTWGQDPDFVYDAEEACPKIMLHRMQ